jgi:CubicO group peptidase (beta-lactamase class C family)
MRTPATIALLTLLLTAGSACGPTDRSTGGSAGASVYGAAAAPGVAGTGHMQAVGMAAAALRPAGLDSALLAAALQRAAELPRLRTLLVARHGELAVERRFRGPGLNEPANVKSVSKSLLSALVGIAIAEGHLEGVDQRVAPFFEEYLRADGDPRKRQITVAQLLSMQSGLERTSGVNYGRWVTSSNWVRHAISRPMVADPGTERLYSTGNSHLLSAVLTQATGRSTLVYARERLAQPLGIDVPAWPRDPQGVYFGGNEMRLTPHAMLRFGELYRNGGSLDGRQIVPESWVQASLTPRGSSRWTGDGYGYGWFIGEVRGHPVYYAWGYGGQFIFVFPGLELTVVTTSDPDAARERDHVRAVRALLDDWIVPAAELGAGRPGGE